MGILSKFMSWLREEQAKNDFNRGYHWALGQLDLGIPPEAISADLFPLDGSDKDFDLGAAKAIRDYESEESS